MYTLPGVSQEYWKSINRNECIERSFQDVSYWCSSLTPPSTYRRCLFSLCEGSVYRVWKKSTAFDSRTPDATGQMVTTEQVASFSLPNSAPSFSLSLFLSPYIIISSCFIQERTRISTRTWVHDARREADPNEYEKPEEEGQTEPAPKTRGECIPSQFQVQGQLQVQGHQEQKEISTRSSS